MKDCLGTNDCLSILGDYIFTGSEISETTLVKHECLVAFYTGAAVAVALDDKNVFAVQEMANILCTALGCLSDEQYEDAETGATRVVDVRWRGTQENCAAALYRFLKLEAKEEYGAPTLL